MILHVLSIAGSDPSGGAGIQADLKTFAALGCDGMAAITALTAQNTRGVQGVMPVPASFVKEQIEAVFDDRHVAAVKIGMLANAEIIHAVAGCLEKYRPAHIVLDPVMKATSGHVLLEDNAITALKKRLIPLVDIVTPNIPEGAVLLEESIINIADSAIVLRTALGAQAVLLKGGHGAGDTACDVLAYDKGIKIYESPRIQTKNTRGTGCRLSAALAACLAQGYDIEKACGRAKDYIDTVLAHHE